MAIRKIKFAPSEFYHVYNRGNSKQIIFHDHEDYKRFLELLFICNSNRQFSIFDIHRQKMPLGKIDKGISIVAVGAYCLMPNHFHLLITPIVDNGVSKFMQKVTTGYTMYYNQKYRRTGGLFEGKFKAEHVSNDRYLKYIFSYIHLNPLSLIEPKWKLIGIRDKAKALTYLKNYAYSSYKEYIIESKNDLPIIDRKFFPNYFPDKKSFQKEIFSWISYREARPPDRLE